MRLSRQTLSFSPGHLRPKLSHLWRDRISLFLLVTVSLFLSSCASYNQNKILAEQKIENQRKCYESLVKDLKSSSLKAGADAEGILKTYCKPADTFSSGSSMSLFEMWTYKNVLENNVEDEANQIHLYFNNSKLISWRY